MPNPDRRQLRWVLGRRCPWCGGGGLFPRWLTLVERCPTCGVTYSREEGYWLSALILNFAVTEGAVGLVIIGGLLLAAPEFAVDQLLIVTGVAVTTALVVSIGFYPWSKLLWMLLDDRIHPRTDVPRRTSTARTPR